MVSALLLTFVLQLAIHLVNTVGAQSINELLWLLYTKLPTPESKKAEDNVKLRRDVARLQRELNGLSAQDQFAKWAKTRREHDKAKDEYEKQSSEIQSFRTIFNRLISTARWLGTQGLQFFCNFYFSKQAMFWLPQGWVPYHVECILSFPRAPLGSVSINIWAMACACVVGLASEAIRASLTLRKGEATEGPNKGMKLKMDARSAKVGLQKKGL